MQATGVIAAESRSCRHPASLTPRFPARVLYPARGFRFFVDQRTAHSSEQRCTQRTNARRPRKDVWVEVQETVKETPQDRLLLYGGLAFVALLVVGPTLIAALSAGIAITLAMSFGFMALPLIFGVAGFFFFTSFLFPFSFGIGFLMSGVLKLVTTIGFALAGVGLGAWGLRQIGGGSGSSSDAGRPLRDVIDVDVDKFSPEDEAEIRRRKDELREFDELLRRRDEFKNRI